MSEVKKEPEKTEKKLESYLCPVCHCCHYYYTTPLPKQNPVDEFKKYLTKVMKAEEDIEDEKLNLAKIPEFNVPDAFRVLNPLGKDDIYPFHVKNGFEKLGVYDPNGHNLFMQKNDPEEKGTINYDQFLDIVTPAEQKDREEVLKRKENNPDEKYFDSNNLDPKVKDGLRRLFQKIVDKERDINYDKKELYRKELDLGEIFPCFKDGNDITHDEFIDYLKNNEIYTNERQAELCYKRFDKNADGKIQPEELVSELKYV